MRDELERQSDLSDRATQREQELLADALENVARIPALPYTGQCLNCGDITGGGRRFCDIDCRDDYELRMKLKGRHASSN